jgi:hypothetical protein
MGFEPCYAPAISMSRGDEMAMGEVQAKMIEEELGAITKRIEDLNK